MIRATNRTKNATIDLDGPQGNAFAVMGFVQSVLKSLGEDKTDIKATIEEMTSGDYLNLIKVGYRAVGEYTIWETDHPEYLEVLNSVED